MKHHQYQGNNLHNFKYDVYYLLLVIHSSLWKVDKAQIEKFQYPHLSKKKNVFNKFAYTHNVELVTECKPGEKNM